MVGRIFHGAWQVIKKAVETAIIGALAVAIFLVLVGFCGGFIFKVFFFSPTTEKKEKQEYSQDVIVRIDDAVAKERDFWRSELERQKARSLKPVEDAREDFEIIKKRKEGEFKEEEKRLAKKEVELEEKLEILKREQGYLKTDKENLLKDKQDFQPNMESLDQRKKEIAKLEKEVAIANKAIEVFLYEKDIPYLYGKAQTASERGQIMQEKRLLNSQLLKLLEEHQKK